MKTNAETPERDWRLTGALEFTQATAPTFNIYLLTELEEIDLSDNYLDELPTSINKLKNLKTLS